MVVTAEVIEGWGYYGFFFSFTTLGISVYSCIQMCLNVVMHIRTVAELCYVLHFFSNIGKLG